MLALISGFVMTGWGLWAIIAFILKRKSQFYSPYDETYLQKLFYGKHYDNVSNIVWGLIWVLIGIGLVIENI